MSVLPLLSKCAFCELSCGVNLSISLFVLEVFVKMLFEKVYVCQLQGTDKINAKR